MWSRRWLQWRAAVAGVEAAGSCNGTSHREGLWSCSHRFHWRSIYPSLAFYPSLAAISLSRQRTHKDTAETPSLQRMLDLLLSPLQSAATLSNTGSWIWLLMSMNFRFPMLPKARQYSQNQESHAWISKSMHIGAARIFFMAFFFPCFFSNYYFAGLLAASVNFASWDELCREKIQLK